MNPTRWARVKALMQAALEEPELSRAEFVRRQTLDDVSLYEEVDSLLAAHAQSLNAQFGRDRCACWQVEWADLLVYDAWISGDGEPMLIEGLEEIHPDKPVVTFGGLTSSHQRTATREPIHTPTW